VLLLAVILVITITRDWNAWEGGKVEQATDDAYVRGDLTPLSTKVPGIVRTVKVADYQKVRAGDLLVELEDEDYRAQVAQATAAIEAAKAAIENNRRQRELQDTKIDKASAGIDLANAQIAAAQAGINASQADVTRTRSERVRQEALLSTQSTTKQRRVRLHLSPFLGSDPHIGLVLPESRKCLRPPPDPRKRVRRLDPVSVQANFAARMSAPTPENTHK